MNTEKKLKEKEISTDELIEQMEITSEDETDLNIIKVTAADFGFTDEYTTQEALEKAQELGLKLCPPWATLQYRLDCPEDEGGTLVGMEPMLDKYSDLVIFYISRLNNTPRLDDVSLYDMPHKPT